MSYGTFEHIYLNIIVFQCDHDATNIRCWTSTIQKLLGESYDITSMRRPGHAPKVAKLWLFVGRCGGVPGEPRCALCQRQLASNDFTTDSSFFDLQRSLILILPGEPESTVGIMKISVICQFVRKRVTAS